VTKIKATRIAAFEFVFFLVTRELKWELQKQPRIEDLGFFQQLLLDKDFNSRVSD
jgi:hypothetical protein